MAINTPAYDSALSDGRFALLPENVKRIYGSVGYRKTRFSAANDTLRETINRLTSFGEQFADTRSLTKPALSRMSEAQLTEYRTLLMLEFEQARFLRKQSLYFLGEVTLSMNLDDHADLLPALLKAANEEVEAYPEDFVRMADEIDAEDAARAKAAK